jgi:hypothetical protein
MHPPCWGALHWVVGATDSQIAREALNKWSLSLKG